MIGRLASILGLSFPVAAWVSFVLACLGSAAVSGVLVHNYDQAQHDKVIADLRADAATELAKANARTLAAQRRDAARLAQLEDAYAELSRDREVLAADGIRLSAGLHDAVERLRRTGAGWRGDRAALPQAAGSAGRCAELSAARDRAVAALELLQAGGDEAAAIGQRAVDVATIAARAARQTQQAPTHE